MGTTATTTSSRVHVHYVSGKGGGFYEVNAVEAHVPGRPGPVSLRGALGPGFEGDIDYATEAEGWQTPTVRSGYAAPLQVRFRVASADEVDAMAERDLQYWLTSTDPEVDLGIGMFGTTLLLASLVPATVRTRRARHTLRRTRKTTTHPEEG